MKTRNKRVDLFHNKYVKSHSCLTLDNEKSLMKIRNKNQQYYLPLGGDYAISYIGVPTLWIEMGSNLNYRVISYNIKADQL